MGGKLTGWRIYSVLIWKLLGGTPDRTSSTGVLLSFGATRGSFSLILVCLGAPTLANSAGNRIIEATILM